MVKSLSKQKEQALPKLWWVILGFVFVAILAFIGYMSWHSTGWPGYLDALNKCGGKPPVQISTGTNLYVKPGDERYRIPGDDGRRYYLCTESQAIESGYRHISY